MKKEPLWFIRQKGETTGPFPVGMIERYVILGRVNEQSELSPDCVHWAPLSAWPELLERKRHIEAEENHDQRMLLSQRWEDERGGFDRRHAKAGVAQEHRRSTTDRRHTERIEAVERRQQRTLRKGLLTDASLRGALIPIIAIVVFVGAYLALYESGPDPVSVDCLAKPAVGVNWSYCDMQNAELTQVSLRDARLLSTNLSGARLESVGLMGADMSFAVLSFAKIDNADFSGARMLGVSLRNTLIKNSNFKNSDLSYADFSNAVLDNVELSNARLDHAVWTDRRSCAAGSIGTCRER